MIVALFVDPYSCDGSDKASEYEELEEFVRECLPELADKLVFRRGVRPHGRDLMESGFKIYLFDIGGMCYVSHNGEMQTTFCKNVLTVANDDRPSSLFIPWSTMTSGYVSHAVYELFIDLNDVPPDEDEPCYTTRLPPNVWCPPRSKTLQMSNLDKEAEIRKWLRHQLAMEQIIPPDPAE